MAQITDCDIYIRMTFRKQTCHTCILFYCETRRMKVYMRMLPILQHCLEGRVGLQAFLNQLQAYTSMIPDTVN